MLHAAEYTAPEGNTWEVPTVYPFVHPQLMLLPIHVVAGGLAMVLGAAAGGRQP